MNSEALERAARKLLQEYEGVGPDLADRMRHRNVLSGLLAEVARLEQEVANAVGDREHVAMRRKLWRERAELAEDALRYIAGYEVAGYDAHLRSEYVARAALGDEAEARKGISGHGRVREANPAVGPLLDRVADSTQRATAVTHGRHCPCSACAREDWTRITGPCGMHGADCPAEYAPASAAADEPGETPA